MKLGDKVTVTDPKTGKTTVREVAGTIVTEDDKSFADFTVKGESGKPEALIATTTHPFWVDSEQAWVEAGDLKPGMRLHTASGDSVTLTAVRSFDKRQRTHDLTVEDVHTYYVLAGATPVLVHNCGDQHVVLGLEAHAEAFAKNAGADHFMQDKDWRGSVWTAANLLKLDKPGIRVSFVLICMAWRVALPQW